MKMPLVFFMLLLTGLFSSSPLWAAANIDHLFSLSLEELLAIKVTGSTLTPKEPRRRHRFHPQTNYEFGSG